MSRYGALEPLIPASCVKLHSNSQNWNGTMGAMPNDKVAVEPSKSEKPSAPAPPEAQAPQTQGCPDSFPTDQKDEIGGVCKPSKPAPKDAYVQPDSEKESGGEG